MPARKRGPAPTLRSAKRLTVLVDGKTMRAVDAFARIQAVNRSSATRMLIADGLTGGAMLAALYAARATVFMVHQEFNSDRFTDRYGEGPKATERLAVIDAAIAKAEGR
jgi:hypothetical protein